MNCNLSNQPEFTADIKSCKYFKVPIVQNLTGKTLPKVTANRNIITNMSNNTAFTFCYTYNNTYGLSVNMNNLANVETIQNILPNLSNETPYQNYKSIQLYCIKLKNRTGKNGNFCLKTCITSQVPGEVVVIDGKPTRTFTTKETWNSSNILYCDNNGDVLFIYPINAVLTVYETKIFFVDLDGNEKEIIGNDRTPYINKYSIIVNPDFTITCNPTNAPTSAPTYAPTVANSNCDFWSGGCNPW